MTYCNNSLTNVSTSSSSPTCIGVVVSVNEETIEVDAISVVLAIGGKWEIRPDKIEEICVASQDEEEATLEERTLDVVDGSGTSTEEVAGTSSDDGARDANPTSKNKRRN